MDFAPPFVPPLVDHIRYFCFAPAHLRIAANMCVLHAVMQLFACWFHCGLLKALSRLGAGLG